MADESEQLRHQIDQLVEEVYLFTRGAVHDLRSAQRGVTVSAELLQNLPDDSLSPEARTILATLLDSAAKGNTVLAAAGNYATALRGSAYSFRAVKVSSVVGDAIAALEPEIRETGAAIAYGELPEVRGDRDRLRELFRQLIDNALKYRGSSPARIEIKSQNGPVQQAGDAVDLRFSVRDYGIGIDRKYQPGLFRPFRRLHGPEIPGLGLGLVICRRIVESHGGRLWIESDAGEGTTVFLTLPPSV